MGVIVAFNYESFIALFPQFGYLPPVQMAGYFSLAAQVHRNDGGGPITDTTTQTNLLNLATAHIVQLMAPRADGTSPPPIVGRINSAGQGSVNVGSEMLMPPGSAQWWNQTPYGAMYWEASKPFRTMRYIPGPARPTSPWPVANRVFPGSGWW